MYQIDVPLYGAAYRVATKWRKYLLINKVSLHHLCTMRYNLNCYSVEIHRIFVFFGSFQVGLNINNTGSMKKSKGYLKLLLSGGGKDSTCSGAKKNKVGEKYIIKVIIMTSIPLLLAIVLLITITLYVFNVFGKPNTNRIDKWYRSTRRLLL